MKMFLKLLIFMSGTGTAMLLSYFLVTRLLPGCISHRWRYRYLKVCMLLYLVPIPLVKLLLPRTRLFLLNTPEETSRFLELDNSIFLLADKAYYVIASEKERAVLLLWMLGFCAVLLVYGVIYLRLRLRIRGQMKSSTEYGDERVLALLEENRLWITGWIRRRIRIVQVRSDCTPFTFGTLHPVIILTGSVGENDGDSVVRHELTHISGWDFLFRVVACVCVLLHFFNPFIYLFFKELKEVQEFSCDERVLHCASEDERSAYARMLARVYEKLNGEEKKTMKVAFLKKKNSLLKQRVKGVIRPIPQKNVLCSVIMLVMLGVSALPVMAYEPPEILDRRETGETSDWYEGIDDIYISLNEPLYPEDEEHFKYTDRYILTEDGTVRYMDSDIQAQAECIHSFVNGTEKKHVVKSDGGCVVYNYSVVVCTRCGFKKSSELSSYHVYVKCPHK